jgi:hypothetical protein
MGKDEQGWDEVGLVMPRLRALVRRPARLPVRRLAARSKPY